MVYGDRIGDRIGLGLYVYEVLFFKLFRFGIVSCEFVIKFENDRVNFSVENLFYGILLIFVRVSVDNA